MSPTDLLQHFLPSCRYNYLGSEAGVVISDLLADTCAGAGHQHPGASEGLWAKCVKHSEKKTLVNIEETKRKFSQEKRNAKYLDETLMEG